MKPSKTLIPNASAEEACTPAEPLDIVRRSLPAVSKYRSPGFTLVELLVVIAIISLLVSILLPALSKARDKAETAYCANNMKQIGIAISNYASDHNGYYPHTDRAAPDISWDDRISGYDGRSALDPVSDSVATGMQAVALGYVEHGPQPLYECPSFKGAASPYQGAVRAIPRSYLMNRFDPGHLHRGNWIGVNYAIGMAGWGEPGSTVLRNSTVCRQDSATPDMNHRPSRAILLVEENNYRGNPSGQKLGARGGTTVGAYFRNAHVAGAPTYNTLHGSHAGGRLDNFLMADGHVESLDFQEVSTRIDGSFVYAGGNWQDTMWDARLGR